MTRLTSLSLTHFRNITTGKIELHPTLNIFHGDNGAGKTSVLEAIFYLSRGRSFRTASAQKLICHQKITMALHGKIQLDNNKSVDIGIEKNMSGSRKVKLNGEAQTAIAPLTQALPLQFMSPMSYRCFHDGPKARRQHLDWALFHVKHSFYHQWQFLQRVLQQRNSALKQRQNHQTWDPQFIEAAMAIDTVREEIFQGFLPICQQQLAVLLPELSFTIEYYRGWPAEHSLEELLYSVRLKEQQLGYTYYGPQRADIILTVNHRNIQDELSQGQQKLAAYAIHLALGKLFEQHKGRGPIYLIDDLASELDHNSRGKIADTLKQQGAQTFITGITSSDLSLLTQNNSSQMFHVKHGAVTRSIG